MKETLERICGILEDGKNLIDENLIIEFQENAKSMLAQMDGIMEEGRVLRIGIVGEVKAGKSSFLNALLFDGQDVLPKAPTPMTAALTKLSYSVAPAATVYFYTNEEWRGIEKRAREYDAKLDGLYEKYKERTTQEEKERQRQKSLRGRAADAVTGGSASRKESVKLMTKEDFERMHRDEIPGEMRSCNEVVQMAKKMAEENGINIYSLLGKKKEITQSGNSTEQYMDDLEEYVGSKGAYTPIVKFTEIQLNNAALEGIEVIDTPGLNDPVQSRSRETEKSLMQCDAVFLLSYCGQFLGAEDIEFISHTLPYEGIHKAVLIGSKLDSAILQYPGRNSTFAKAYMGTKRNCNEQAQENIGKCMKEIGNSALMEQLYQALPPILTSAMAYSAGVKRQKGNPLSKEEEHMVSQMKKRYPDYQDTVEYLMNLAGIDEAQGKGFKETKTQKEQIIQERVSSFQAEKKSGFLKDLEEISIRIRTTLSDLENYDGARLEEQLADMCRRLDSARYEVKTIFEKAAIEATHFTNELKVDAMDAMRGFKDIGVESERRTEHHSSTSGALFWKKTEHWDEIITEKIAGIHDVDNNMKNYNIECCRIINASFNELIHIDNIRNRVKDAVMKAFDQQDPNFDENKILYPLDTALNKLTIIPIPEMNLDKYTKKLDSKLEGIATNGVVKNNDIHELIRIQGRILSEMANDIIELIGSQGDKITETLNKEAGLFIDNIEKTLKGDQERLKKLIAEKEKNRQRLLDFLNQVTIAKAELQQA